MIPGDRLPNGAIVLDSSADDVRRIVLAIRTDTEVFGDAFVTWICAPHGDGSDTRWGDYSDTLEAAVSNYRDRCQHHGVATAIGARPGVES